MLSSLSARNTHIHLVFGAFMLFQHKDSGTTADSSCTEPTTSPWDAHTPLFDGLTLDRWRWRRDYVSVHAMQKITCRCRVGPLNRVYGHPKARK